MRNILYRMMALACFAAPALQTATAQQTIPRFDAQQKRLVLRASSAQQHVWLDHLEKGQTYVLTVSANSQESKVCLPGLSTISPQAQVLGYDAALRQLNFVASDDAMEFLLSYPCSWDPSNEPAHYLSVWRTSTSAPSQQAVSAPSKPQGTVENTQGIPLDGLSSPLQDFNVSSDSGDLISFYSIINNCNSWTASGVPSWVTVGLSGNVTVAIHYDENTSSSPRTANLVISGCGNTIPMTIIQAGAPFKVVDESVESLIKNVFLGGNCLDINNITYSGLDQKGKFMNGLNSVGFDQGLLLSTGSIDIAPGPNDSDGASGGYGVSTPDADLNTISSGALFDMASIEFDFTPTQNQFSFEFVFASEEYCEYVNTQFSDVFGIFISGPGINGTKNLALVPATSVPVTINNINHLANSGYYIHNTPASGNNCGSIPPATGQAVQELQYDGFTRKIVASTQVTACNTYHLKIKIADVGDGVWDSALFLKAGSLNAGANASIDWLVNGQKDVQVATEGCDNVGLLLDRVGANIALPLPVSFNISGTASNGTDYGPLSQTYIIPAGTDQLVVPVNIVNDLIPENAETVRLQLNNACTCSNPLEILTIKDYEPMLLDGDTIAMCGSGIAHLEVGVTGGVAPYTYQWVNGSTETYLEVFAAVPTNYKVTITDACGKTATANTRVNIVQPPSANFIPPVPQFCPGQTGQLLVNFNGVGPFVLAYQINGVPQPPLYDIVDDPYTITISQVGTYQLTTVIDGNGCSGTGIGAATVINSTLSVTGLTTDATCDNAANGSINTSVAGGLGPYQYIWSGPTAIGNLADPQNLLSGTYLLTVTDAAGCFKELSFLISAPHCQWDVFPTGRNHTIVLPANLVSDADFPLQAGDLIGAFYDSLGTPKCAGYGTWSSAASAFAVYGNDAVPPAKNGFNTGETFKIRVWRQALNQEFDATVQYAPPGTQGIVTHTNAFADDGISMMSAISTGLKLPLSVGWNMISSYIIPAQPSMLDVFEPIAPSIDIVKDGDGNSMIPALQINNIGDWDIRKGYQVKANTLDTLCIAGPKIIPENVPILLKPGWQIIGYLRDSPQNMDTVFKAIKSQIILVKDNSGKIYSPQFGINTIGNMKPGQGYKVNAASNVTLLYRPNFAGPLEARSGSKPDAQISHFILNANLNTGQNASIFLANAQAIHGLQPGDELGVFTHAGTLCGAAKYMQENLAITVWGDDPHTPSSIEGLQPGEAYQFKVWNPASHTERSLLATLQSGATTYEPDAIERFERIEMGSLALTALDATGIYSLELYPNPASDYLNIRIGSEHSGKAHLSLIGLNQAEGFGQQEVTFAKGESAFRFQIPANLSSGVYTLRCQFDQNVINRLVFISNKKE